MKDLVNNITPNAPCKECHANKESYLGCHDKCEKYKEYKEKSDKAKQEVREKKNFERTFYAEKRNVCTRVLRAKKR